MNLVSNTQYFAKGASCFLAGTKIKTPTGTVLIEKVKAGQKVTSYNETTGKHNTSVVERLDELEDNLYYVINNKLSVTAEHPVYITAGAEGTYNVMLVKDLQEGHELVHSDGTTELITSIERVHEQVKVYNLINVEPNHNYYANDFLVHNKGGFSGGARSTTSTRSSGTTSKSTSTSTSTKSTTTSKPAAPKTVKQSTKPGSTVKTASGKTVKTSTHKPAKPGFTKEKGVVGVNGYQPRFQNGYNAPEGSVVYYRDNNLMDYFFIAYLFNSNNQARPENQQATVVTPDNKEVEVKPVAGGTDGMMIVNWIILIIVVCAIIGGIVWLVNKITNKPTTKKPSYGY